MLSLIDAMKKLSSLFPAIYPGNIYIGDYKGYYNLTRICAKSLHIESPYSIKAMIEKINDISTDKPQLICLEFRPDTTSIHTFDDFSVSVKLQNIGYADTGRFNICVYRKGVNFEDKKTFDVDSIPKGAQKVRDCPYNAGRKGELTFQCDINCSNIPEAIEGIRNLETFRVYVKP